jgi:hypothetical protein
VHYIMIYFMLIWFIAHLGLVDIPQRMLNIFFLYCNRFDAQRNILYRSHVCIATFTNSHQVSHNPNCHLITFTINLQMYTIDLNTLLFGSQIYNIDTNRHVFITVQTYIKETCRFSFRSWNIRVQHNFICKMTNRTDLYNNWTSI